MIKNFLIAAALVIASPALVFSQDVFWSFDSASAQSTTAQDGMADGVTGTAFIFVDGLFALDALDLNFTSSDSSVLLLTGGVGTNPTFNAVGGMRFDSSVVTIDPAATGTNDNGNLFSVNVAQNGINPALGPLFDPDFDANVGPNGATLIASIDYQLVGNGTATLDFSLGSQGALQLPDIILDPAFGSGTLTATNVGVIPEPSSAAMLVLGSIGLVARRRRS